MSFDGVCERRQTICDKLSTTVMKRSHNPTPFVNICVKERVVKLAHLKASSDESHCRGYFENLNPMLTVLPDMMFTTGEKFEPPMI